MSKGKCITIEELLQSDEFGRIDPSQHGVSICYLFPHGRLSSDKAFDAVIAFQYILDDILEENIGHVNGHEFCESLDSADEDAITFFLSGRDADEMYAAISPVLFSLPYLPGSYAIKQFGNSGKEDVQIFL